MDRELVPAAPPCRQPRLDPRDAEGERPVRAPRREGHAVGHEVLTGRRRRARPTRRDRRAEEHLPALAQGQPVRRHVDHHADAGRVVRQPVDPDPAVAPWPHVG